jgi:hypothetical protein
MMTLFDWFLDYFKITMKQHVEILRRIARYLMLHGSFISNIGLLNGKTGIVIFFYHYARYSGQKIFDRFAGEMISEIYREINVETPYNFRDGLCGIGWGWEYLIRNGFVKTDSDSIFEELDKKIIELDVRCIEDNSLETGLTGIACYVISRTENRENTNRYITPVYMDCLIHALESKSNGNNENRLLVGILENIVNKREVTKSYNPVFKIIEKNKYRINDILLKSGLLGIGNAGYAGIGLKLMGIDKL